MLLPCACVHARNTCDRGHGLVASRRERGRAAETVDECRSAAGPTAGDRVHYQDEAHDEAGPLVIDLILDSVSADPPAAEAFADPDVASAP